jgi:hypothetical protein
MDLGSLDARDVDGPFEISTRQKDITLEDFKHAVRISDTNGDIQLRTSVAPTRPIEVDSKKGDIQLALPADAGFHIEASSQHGEAQSDFAGPNLKVQNEGAAPSITGSYGKGGPKIRLTTAYGTIHLTHQGLGAPAPPAAPTPPAREALPAGGEDETLLRLPVALRSALQF